MKRKNVKRGQHVKVKKSTQRNPNRAGLIGVVAFVEGNKYSGNLTVNIKFDEKDGFGSYRAWFNHKDVKLVTDVEELNNDYETVYNCCSSERSGSLHCQR